MDELQTQNIDGLTSEILILKDRAEQSIIEIGKRLIIVKESLPHGDWGNYLKEKVYFHQTTANRFMKVAKEFSNQASMLSLGTGKLFALLDLPAEERETFIEDNHVDEMTTRELRLALKEKKASELRVQELEKRLEAEHNKQPVEVEKIVLPDDYEDLRKKVEEFEAVESHSRKQAAEYKTLKTQIANLIKTKDDFNRQIDAVTELSGLVAKVEDFLKTELAPIKYSRAIHEQKQDEIVQRNLKEIVGRVQDWCDEMHDLVDEKNYVDVEASMYE
jgi:hypothetical protein